MITWKQFRLDECCEIVSGATPSTGNALFWGGDICWATPKDLSDLQGAYIWNTHRKLTHEGLKSCAATILPAESVLFSSRAPIGHVAINAVPMATNQGFKNFVPKKDRLHAKFLYYWLRKNRPYLESLGNGATFKEVSKATVSRIEISLPPMEDQKRIAAILDKADAIRRKRQQAIKLADDFLRATFLDMFGDPVTNPKEWKVVSCNSICKRITVGIVVRPASYYKDSGIPALRSLNVRANQVTTDNLVYFSQEDNETKLAKTRVWKDDLLLVRSGQPGTAAIVPSDLDGVNAIDILITTPDKSKVDPTYLCFYFNSERGKQMVLGEQRGQIQKHLNVGSLNVAPILLPPIQLQREFSKRVEKLQKISGVQKLGNDGFANLFNALTQRAFRGDL